MPVFNNLRKIVLYCITKGASDGLLALRGIILASFLGPEAFGGWVLFRLATNYFGFAHLGVPRGLEFFTARANGSDEESEIVFYWRSALGFVLAVFGVLSTAMLGASFFVADQTVALGMRWFSGAILTEQLWLLGLSYLRARGNLREFAIYEFLNAALHVIFSLVLAPVWGLAGAFSGFVLATTISLILLARPFPKMPALSWGRLRDMLKIGMPILVSLLIGFSLASADRLIVAGKGDIALLGLYGFAFAIAGISGSLATVIRVVLYPEVYASVAAQGEGPALEAHLKGTVLPFARLVPPMLGLLALLIAPIVSVWLPEYVGAIPAARILIFVGATAGFERLGALGVIAVQRQKILPFFSAGALIINVTLSFLALWSGLGLQGVACASVFSNAMFGIATITIIAGLAQATRPAAYLFKVLSPLIWCVTVVFLISIRWPVPGIPDLLPAVGIYLVAMTPLFPALLSEFRKAKKIGSVSVLDSN